MKVIQADSHSLCCWRDKNLLSNLFWLIALVCHLERKNIMDLKIYWLAKESTSSTETVSSTTVTNSPSNGTENNSNTTKSPSNSKNQDLTLCINQFPNTTVTVPLRTHLAVYTHYSQNHPKSTWKRCSNKTCTFWDLNQSSSQLKWMMRIENSWFHFIVVMTLFKCMKFAIRTLEELEASLWKERSITTQLPRTTIKRKTSWLAELSSLVDTNSNYWRVMNTQRSIWKTTVTHSSKPT